MFCGLVCGTESEIIMYGNPHLLTYRLITSGIDTGPRQSRLFPGEVADVWHERVV